MNRYAKIYPVILATCLFSIPVCAENPEQDQVLSNWIKNGDSVDQIITNANNFNKKMNAYEGISCVLVTGKNEYEYTSHPDAYKMAEQKTPPGPAKVLWNHFIHEAQGNKINQGDEVDYSYGGKKKRGVVYKLDDKNYCLSFWLDNK